MNAKHRVVASERISHGQFSLSLLPGDYMLHANQRSGFCHRYDSCNVYRAVLAVAHHQQTVELDVPPPPCITARGRGTISGPGARVQRRRGIGLVIATDSETGLPGESRGYIKMPPLPSPDQCGWSVGSALAGQPHIETLWFRGNHKLFIASVKVGASATGADGATVDRIIHSLHFQSARH